jgi:hypothetical protein
MLAAGMTHHKIGEVFGRKRQSVSSRVATLRATGERGRPRVGAGNDDINTQSTDAFSRMIRNGTTKLFIALQEAGYVREAA